MSWRDGCAPRPAVAEGAEPVAFDFAGADAIGGRLDGLRLAVGGNLDARAGATPRLVDWAGAHRLRYDDHRSTQEGVLSGAGIDLELSRLRAAWDDAADAQVQANRRAAEAAPTAPPSSGPNRPI